ncbi:MAG: autotransporter-associated beta strand repeat-containing protein [Luteolibacter sp.]
MPEKLGRGVIALRGVDYGGNGSNNWEGSGKDQVFISWRLFATDPESVSFNIYRSAAGGTEVKLNSAPLTDSTNYVDTTATLTVDNAYCVKPVIDGVEGAPSESWTLPANSESEPCFAIPMPAIADGSYGVSLAWAGDLDGDGYTDFVVVRFRTDGSSSLKLEGYSTRTRSRLWQIDYGPNSATMIDAGQRDGVTVFDFDGDGKCEVITKVCPGTILGDGAVVPGTGSTSYLSVLEGATGKELSRIQTATGVGASSEPINLAVAFLDGIRPSLVAMQVDKNFGIYNIEPDTFTITKQTTYTRTFAAAHNFRIGDLNGDGKDDISDIGGAIDSSGTILFSNELNHGDRFHVADIDPEREGLECFAVQQYNPSMLSYVLFDATTGETLWRRYASTLVDNGRGNIGSLLPTLTGQQMWSASSSGLTDSKGNLVTSTQPACNFSIWWDGDVQREILNGWAIDKYNVGRQLTGWKFHGASSLTRDAQPLYGDIFGDWREEMVSFSPTELIIFSTTKPAANRFYTFLQDPTYRMDMTLKGYMQSHHPGFYFGTNMPRAPRAPVWDGDLIWVGSSFENTWDQTSVRWKASPTGSTSSSYSDGKSVLFDLSGVSSIPVNLPENLAPSRVVVHAVANQAYTFSGSGALTGSMSLTKGGAGILTLSGNHSYTGDTVVSEGLLMVNGQLTGSALRVDSRGSLGGTGTIGQHVDLSEIRAKLAPGGIGIAGTLSLTGGLSEASGAVNQFDLSSDPSGTNDLVSVTGNLTFNGSPVIDINLLNGTLSPGTYTLFTYTGTFTGNLSSVVLRGVDGFPCTLANTGSAITLTVAPQRAASSLVWLNGVSGNWMLGSGTGWLKSGTSDTFVTGDAVRFDDTGTIRTVTLPGMRSPASTEVDSSGNYTFTGNGGIAGSGGLTKNGTGTLTISTANPYTGPTIVNGGILSIDSLSDTGQPSPIGASSNDPSNFVINGATLRITGNSTGTFRGLTVGASGATIEMPVSGAVLSLGGTITGSGSLTKTGLGRLIINAVNTYTGGTIIKGGTIVLAGSYEDASPTSAITYGLGTGGVTLDGGTLTLLNTATSDLDFVDSTASWPIIVPAGSSGRLDANGRMALGSQLTGGGDFTFYTPFIRTALTGNWSAFTGRINVITDSDGGEFRVSNTFGYANSAIHLGDRVSVYYASTVGAAGLTLSIGELSGTTTSYLRGGPNAGRTLTWELGARNTDSTYAGTIQNATSQTALTKVGTGTLTLTGVNTYTGATTVTAGKLALNNGSLTSNVTVASGAGFGGNGSVTGNVHFATGSILLGNPTVGPLDITGNLAFNGAVTVSPIPGAALSDGTYLLYTYTGTLTGAPDFTWSGAGYTAVFDTSIPGQILVTLTAPPRDPADIFWTGVQSSTWDGTTVNWTWTSGSTFFQAGDRVHFDDTSTVTGVVLSGARSPESVSVESDQNYTFGGSGTLTGTASLTKTGTGALFISPTLLSVSSTTTLNSPTVTVTNPSELIVGMTVSGTGIAAGTTISSISGSTVTLSANATASGTNSLNYYATHTFSGGTTISSGSVILANTAANSHGLGTGKVFLNGGTLQLFSYGSSSTSAGVFSRDIQVDSGFSGTLIGFGRGVISGALTGAGTFNYQPDYVRADVSGNWSAFTGQINVTRGPANGEFRISNTNGFGIAKINLGPGTTMYMNVNFGAGGLTNTIGELTGSGTLKGGPTVGRTMTWNIGGADTDAQFDGVIDNSNGPTAIIKFGSGTWILTGSSTYTGTTSVTNGALLVTGSLTSSAVSTAAGATIGGTGNLSGNLTLASGGHLALGIGPSSTNGLVVSGTATLNGSITVIPALLGGTLTPGTYTLLTYSGTLGGSPSFVWNDTTGSGYTATFDTTVPGVIRITLSAPPPAVPTNLTATGGNSLVSLTWSDVPDASSYELFRSTTSGSGYTVITDGITSASYTDHNLSNGTTYYYVVKAISASGPSDLSTQASATPMSLLQSWRQNYFNTINATGDAANQFDPDGDSIPNLLEYALGTNPTASTLSPVQTSLVDNALQITFPRIADPDLTYTVQGSSDLINWSTIWSSSGSSNVEGTVTVSDTVTGADRRFLRLCVTISP